MNKWQRLKWQRVLGAAISTMTLASVWIPFRASAYPYSTHEYLAGATLVFKQENQSPDLDRGEVLCDPGRESGIGGDCLPFPPNFGPDSSLSDDDGSVRVMDSLGQVLNPPDHVAFQVCIDNNGDHKCTSGGDSSLDPCSDFVAYSHSDTGLFFNPLGPLPTRRKQGCDPDNNGWNGYVVFICNGIHAAKDSQGLPAHVHPSSQGTIQVEKGAGFGAGQGNFCGGTRELVVEKAYDFV